jgi:hypothetical protein
MQQCIKILLFLILNEAQLVSGDTPSIIRSLNLHKQPLVLHTWKVVGRAVVGRCQVAYERVQSCRLLMMGGVSPETCWASFKIRNNKFRYIVARCWGFHCKNCNAFSWYAHKCGFQYSHQKCTASSEPIFAKLTNALLLYIQINYVEFHLNQFLKVKSADRNSSTLLMKLWLSLCQSSR